MLMGIMAKKITNNIISILVEKKIKKNCKTILAILTKIIIADYLLRIRFEYHLIHFEEVTFHLHEYPM